MRIAILASGTGTNAEAIIKKSRDGILQAQIALILSNNPRAGVLEKARRFAAPVMVLDHREFPNRESHDLAMMDALHASHCDAVVLAGYMRLLSHKFLEVWQNRILNIHPALLPSFPGVHGAEDALNYGVKLTGPTVHFVTEEMDAGPIIIQAAVPVNAGESLDALKQKIHALEHRIYPQAVQWLAQGRLLIQGRIVHLEPGDQAPARDTGEYFVWPPLEEGF